MRIARIALAALLLLLRRAGAGRRRPRACGTAPENWSGTWGLDVEASSAALARDGWKFLAMSTLSWPDGRQAVVTMWMSQLGDFARCFDYFDAQMVQAGGKCERSGTGL